MISQFKVPANLAIELPGMTEELRNISGSLNVIKTMQCLAKYTRRKVVQRDLKMVKKCFMTAENFYSSGDRAMKDAIENVYIYSFSSFLV